MKKYLIICIIVIGLIPLHIKAQGNESATNPDSIKSRIIEILKLKNLTFYYFAWFHSSSTGEYKNRPWYQWLRPPMTVSIVDDTINLSFRKREIPVSLLQKIKKNNDPVIYNGSGGILTISEGLIWGSVLILGSPTELIQLQEKYINHYYWNDFDKIANDYKSLKVKPTISEEQRKYIVQANSMSENKDYSNAIQLYNKVIETNPTAYPPAYFNLALLLAHTGNYLNAIINLKKYLLLVPDAKDARAAQDQIYEWELKLEK